MLSSETTTSTRCDLSKMRESAAECAVRIWNGSFLNTRRSASQNCGLVAYEKDDASCFILLRHDSSYASPTSLRRLGGS